MRKSTGLALIAIGAVLVLAVNAQPSFLNLKLTGLVLVLTGLAGLGAPQRACTWLRTHRAQIRQALAWFDEPPDAPRVPLDTLLRP